MHGTTVLPFSKTRAYVLALRWHGHAAANRLASHEAAHIKDRHRRSEWISADGPRSNGLKAERRDEAGGGGGGNLETHTRDTTQHTAIFGYMACARWHGLRTHVENSALTLPCENLLYMAGTRSTLT